MVLEKVIVTMMSFAIMAVVQTFIYKMLLEAKCTGENYKGEQIPVGLGIAYAISLVTSAILSNLYFNGSFEAVYGLGIGVLSMGFVGLIDDMIGDKGTKGFKGHVKSLFKGKLTTGGLKAISGFGIAMLLSLSISDGLIDGVINTLLIALFTNIINLFDLRPGRACKAFLFLGASLLLTASERVYDFLMLSAVGTVLAYMGLDLKAKSMLGDVGSNAMGITLGLFCAYTSSFKVKIAYLSVLIILHIVSEFYSFTKIIEKNRLLKSLDRLGRR